MSEHPFKITIVVNGQPTEVEAHPKHKLESLIAPALHKTHNTGQPPENWELRDSAGMLLDINEKIEDFHFAPDTRLMLNLKAGVGG
jgi:Protein of Unknown function (DUF2604)